MQRLGGMKRLIVVLVLSAACASQRVPPPEHGIRITVIVRRPLESGIGGGIVGARYVAPDGFSNPKARVSLKTRRTP